METYLLQLLLEWAVDATIKVKVRRIVDGFNNFCVQLGIDENGNGVLDEDEVLTTVKSFIPDLSDGYTLCNKGSEVGIGVPVIRTVDSEDVIDWFASHDEFITSGDVVVIDKDRDGECDDVLIPLNFDVTGDRVNDWGWIVDDNDDGLPDASDNAPFYPVGSSEFQQIVKSDSDDGSIIIMGADGSMSVYDLDGTLSVEDCDTAYSLWVADNGILNKPLDNYSVSEGLLFLLFLVSVGYFIRGLFRRKDYIR